MDGWAPAALLAMPPTLFLGARVELLGEFVHTRRCEHALGSSNAAGKGSFAPVQRRDLAHLWLQPSQQAMSESDNDVEMIGFEPKAKHDSIINNVPKRNFYQETLSTHQRLLRAAKASTPLDTLLPSGLGVHLTFVAALLSVRGLPARCIAYAAPLSRCTRAQCKVEYLIGFILPPVFMAMGAVRAEAWVRAPRDAARACDRDVRCPRSPCRRVSAQTGARNVCFAPASNHASLVVAESGGQKSGALSFITKQMRRVLKWMGAPDILITEYTTESLFKFMAEHGGQALIAFHEFSCAPPACRTERALTLRARVRARRNSTRSAPTRRTATT